MSPSPQSNSVKLPGTFRTFNLLESTCDLGEFFDGKFEIEFTEFSTRMYWIASTHILLNFSLNLSGNFVLSVDLVKSNNIRDFSFRNFNFMSSFEFRFHLDCRVLEGRGDVV